MAVEDGKREEAPQRAGQAGGPLKRGAFLTRTHVCQFASCPPATAARFAGAGASIRKGCPATHDWPARAEGNLTTHTPPVLIVCDVVDGRCIVRHDEGAVHGRCSRIEASSMISVQEDQHLPPEGLISLPLPGGVARACMCWGRSRCRDFDSGQPISRKITRDSSETCLSPCSARG